MVEVTFRGHNEHLPIIVCIPGMLGMPENFERMAQSWSAKFASVFVDLHPQNRESGLRDSTHSLSTVSYDNTSQEIRDWLVNRFPGRRFWFLGVSIGGKLVLDFAARYPELYEGGVITDVGLGAFEKSDLFRFIDEVIPALNLEQDWTGIKADLRAKIPVNAVRVLIQTQVEYSAAEKRGEWKKAVKGLKKFLGMQRIADQWSLLPHIQKPTTVLKAEFLSGIAPEDFERMRTLDLFRFEIVTGSAHLLHVTHPEWIERAVGALVTPLSGVETHSVRV